jgi:hypothetical protein
VVAVGIDVVNARVRRERSMVKCKVWFRGSLKGGIEEGLDEREKVWPGVIWGGRKWRGTVLGRIRVSVPIAHEKIMRGKEVGVIRERVEKMKARGTVCRSVNVGEGEGSTLAAKC